ncbi:MAG: hypothetical protein K9J75_00585 [Cyanobium usitatum Tobar12.5m-G36]|nr:hypothetical protein [Cyanobium usitatum Tobar12.5m-G36]
MAELSDADLEAAMRPINEWIDAQQRAPQWDLVAARLNEYLGDWPGSPWTAEEVNTLAMALAMAQEATDG